MAGMDFVYAMGIAAVFCGLLAYLPYLRDMIWGQTRPLRSTWLVWSVLATISFVANIDMGAAASLPYVGLQAGVTVVIFLLSIRYGSGSWFSKSECAVIGLAAIGLILWSVTDHSYYALLISVGVSSVAGAATIRKAYLNPSSETKACWWWSSIGAFCGLLAVGSLNPLLLIYPIYLFVLYSGILIAMTVGERHAAAQVEINKPIPLLLPRQMRVANINAEFVEAA